MNYNSDSRHSGSTSDPLAELVWKIALALLITLGAPIIIIGLVGSRQLQERFPTRQYLVWSIVVVLALACGAVGYHFFWPINRPGSAFTVLTTDFALGLHKGGQWDYWRLVREIAPVWAMELLLAPLAVIVCGLSE